MKKGRINESVKTESLLINDFNPAYTLTVGDLRTIIREELKALSLVVTEPLIVDSEANWLDLGAIARHLGMSRQSIYRLRSKGKLPKPSFIGTRARWSKKEVDAMISVKKK